MIWKILKLEEKMYINQLFYNFYPNKKLRKFINFIYKNYFKYIFYQM